MRVELHYHRGCPNAPTTRELLQRCLARLHLNVPVLELEGDHPSPSILVDGLDVMGQPTSPGQGCRLDLPTESVLLEALSAAAREPDSEP